MNLTAYSDSEDSEGDAPVSQLPITKPSTKPFQKVIDRSNPGRIKLDLPAIKAPLAGKDEIDADAPPLKKAKIGGGAFGGFNAMLPAPKKPKIDVTTHMPAPGNRGIGKGLGAGVNLKTGSEPAFRRERKQEEETYDDSSIMMKKEPLNQTDFRALLSLPASKADASQEAKRHEAVDFTPKEAVHKIQSAPRSKFMPMSVARGKKKKMQSVTTKATEQDRTTDRITLKSSANAQAGVLPPVKTKPKVSLFSLPPEEASASKDPGGEYRSLIYGAEHIEDESLPDQALDKSLAINGHALAAPTTEPSALSNKLAGIASDLNLSESERRQLFGRKGQEIDGASAKIMEFNTDAEYAHNEFLRAQGETVQPNALRSITGTGKNNLRSLINVATTQKDALEDHFAQGRRNKKEAGNKYGW